MLAVLMIVPAVAMLAAARWIEALYVEKICRGGNGLFDAMSGDNGLLD